MIQERYHPIKCIELKIKDVVCLDATRVVLTHEVPPATDYIHANWVKFEKHDRAYIMTQVSPVLV